MREGEAALAHQARFTRVSRLMGPRFTQCHVKKDSVGTGPSTQRSGGIQGQLTFNLLPNRLLIRRLTVF